MHQEELAGVCPDSQGRGAFRVKVRPVWIVLSRKVRTLGN